MPKAGLEPARPKPPDFESGTSTNSITRANKTHSLVPKAPASVGSSCRTNSRAVFLNPQDWGVPTPTASVSTALRQGADNRTEIFFPFKERKIISTKFLHYLSDLININNQSNILSADKWFVPCGGRTHKIRLLRRSVFPIKLTETYKLGGCN